MGKPFLRANGTESRKWRVSQCVASKPQLVLNVAVKAGSCLQARSAVSDVGQGEPASCPSGGVVSFSRLSGDWWVRYGMVVVTAMEGVTAGWLALEMNRPFPGSARGNQDRAFFRDGMVWFSEMMVEEEAVDRAWTGRVRGGDEAIGC